MISVLEQARKDAYAAGQKSMEHYVANMAETRWLEGRDEGLKDAREQIEQHNRLCFWLVPIMYLVGLATGWWLS